MITVAAGACITAAFDVDRLGLEQLLKVRAYVDTSSLVVTHTDDTWSVSIGLHALWAPLADTGRVLCGHR